MSKPIDAGIVAPGEYVHAGEKQGVGARFTGDRIAAAFGVDPVRVDRAMAGEFGLDTSASVDSRQAQQLAEVILGDQTLDVRQAALMKLGAFTPRSDAAGDLGEKAPGEESDRLVRSVDDLQDG